MKKTITISLLLSGILFATESIYDGTGSLINPSVQSGWGTYRDEAKMQPHNGANSMVTFQWYYDQNRCEHIDIHADKQIDVVINTKAWNNPEIEKSYNATLPQGDHKQKDGVTVLPTDPTQSVWTTISVTSKQPVNEAVAIYAYCRNNTDAKNTSAISETYGRSTLLNGYVWLGNGSLISTTPTTGRYSNYSFGITKDEAVTNDNYNFESSFQVQYSSECSKVILGSKNGTGIKVENMLIKPWNEAKWKPTNCNTLPCVIDLYDNTYTLIKTQGKKDANIGTLLAVCNNYEESKVDFSKDTKVSIRKHPYQCKFEDVDRSNQYYDAITSLCSAGIVQGDGEGSMEVYGYEPYSHYRPSDGVQWDELTKIVQLSENQSKVIQIANSPEYQNLSGFQWGKPYMDLAKAQGFVKNAAEKITKGYAYRYIAKIFWGEDKSESGAASFLQSKGMISSTSGLTQLLTRAEIAKIALESARASGEDTGVDRKLHYINHNDSSVDDAHKDGTLPANENLPVSIDDSSLMKEAKIEFNRKNAEESNAGNPFVDKEGNVDSSAWAGTITGQDPDLSKEKDADELKAHYEDQGKAIPVTTQDPIKALLQGSMVFIEDKDGDSAVGVVGKDKSITVAVSPNTNGDVDENGVESFSVEDLQKDGAKIDSFVKPDDIDRPKDDGYTPPLVDTIKPTASISGVKNITQGTGSMVLSLSANDNEALSSMQLTITKGSSIVKNQSFSLSGTSKVVTHTLSTSSYTAGTYAVLLSVTDEAGNVGNALSRSFNVTPPPVTDTTKPTGSISGVTNIIQGHSSLSLTLKGYDNALVNLNLKVYNLNGNVLVASTGWGVSVRTSYTAYHTLPTSNYDAGTYRVELTVTDKSGNSSQYIKKFTVSPQVILSPEAPTNVKASDGTYTNNVKISWNSASGANEYHVYRSLNETSGYTRMTKTTDTYTFDTDINPTQKYYYKVKSYNTSTGKYSEDSLVNSGYIKLKAPTSLSATDGTYDNKVRLTWNSVSYANQYYIYRATYSNGTYTNIGHTSNPYYEDTTATSNTTYYYKVVAEISSIARARSDYSNLDNGYSEEVDTIIPTGSVSTFFDNYRKGNKIYLRLFANVNGDKKLSKVRLHVAKSSDINNKLVDKLYEPNYYRLSENFSFSTSSFQAGEYQYAYFVKDNNGKEMTPIHGYFNIHDGEVASLKPVISRVSPSTMTKGQTGVYMKIYGTNMDQVTKVYIPGVIDLEYESSGTEPNFYKSKDYVSIRIPEVYGSGNGVPYGDRPITLLTNNGRVDAVPNLLYVNE